MKHKPRTSRSPVIVGLGMTELGKVYGKSADSSPPKPLDWPWPTPACSCREVDGLLVSAGVSNDVGLELQVDLGLRDSTLLTQMQAFGSTAGAMVQYASMAVEAGMAEVVVCVFGDAPLAEGTGTGHAYSDGHRTHSPDGRGFNGRRAPWSRTCCTHWPRGDTCSGTARPPSSSVPSPSPSGTGPYSTRWRRCVRPSPSPTTNGRASSAIRSTCSTAASCRTVGSPSW